MTNKTETVENDGRNGGKTIKHRDNVALSTKLRSSNKKRRTMSARGQPTAVYRSNLSRANGVRSTKEELLKQYQAASSPACQQTQGTRETEEVTRLNKHSKFGQDEVVPRKELQDS